MNNSFVKNELSDIKIDYFKPHRIKVNVETFNDDTFLTLSQLYYPGWNAYLDGERIPIYLTDGIIQGVLISGQGQHDLVFKYEPVTFKIGIALMFIGVCGCFWFYKKGGQFLKRFS